MSGNKSPIVVRALHESDRTEWQEKFSAYADFYQVPLPQSSSDAVWEWIFDPNNNFWCAVAEDNHQNVVGFTQYQLMHRSLGGSMVCYLSDLYVDPQVRGSGAGRALIDHVFGFARDNGIENVRWLTQDYNYSARKLYDSYGRKSDFLLYSFGVDQ